MFKTVNELPITRMYEEYYWVKFSYLLSRTQEQLALRGIRSSEYDQFNKSIDKEVTTTQLNISQIFELHQRGVSVSLVNYNDSAKVYEVVHTHLKHCKEYIASAIHMADEEFIRELIELDLFASCIYEKAVNVFSDEDVYNFNTTSMPFAQRLNSMNVFKRQQNKIIAVTTNSGNTVVTTQQDPNDKPKILERNTLRDTFSSHLDQLSGWRSEHGKK